MSQGGILDPVLSGLLGGAETAVSQIGDGVTSAIGGVTSVVGGVLTPIIAPSSSSSSRSSVSSTPTPSKPTVTPLSSSISSSRSSASQSSSQSSSSSSSPSSTTASPTVVEITSDGVPRTITSIVTAPAVTSPTSIPPPPPPKSFLQNKPLSGFVFALAGIVGLVLVVLVATFAMRRSRRKKLENEAADISYDPGRVSYRDDANLVEKGSVDGYSSNGHGGYQGPGYGPTQRIPAYGQYPNYAPRSPNPYEHQFAAVPAPNQVYVPGRGSPELYRSPSRASDSSAFGAHVPVTAPPVPPSLFNGGATRSPPPVASAPPPVTPLPATFGDHGSLDERQGAPTQDLKVANQ